MSNKIIFTIVAQNYFGLAEALSRSVFKNSTEVTFYVFIADEPKFKLPGSLQHIHYIIAKNHLGFNQEVWDNLSFKYNITEFCTSIKPACFQYLINKYEEDSKIIYFDPDIFVFNSLDKIFTELNDKFIVLTPHIITLQEFYSGDELETDFLASGICNLGFLALKVCDHSKKIIKWWHQRLLSQCFMEKTESLFTDQKWMDFIPSFFEKGVLISREIGRNVAPWNFFERKLIYENESFHVENRLEGGKKTELVFFHFSGFNYKSLKLNVTKSIPNLNIENYEDLLPVFDYYKEELSKTQMKDYLNLKYTYSYFDNGVTINSMHRRFYRRLYIDGNNVLFPFESKGEFFKKIEASKLITRNTNVDFDKINEGYVKGYEKKIYYLNVLSIGIKRLLGVDRYYMLLRFLPRYFKTENQIFLFRGKYLRNSFKK